MMIPLPKSKKEKSPLMVEIDEVLLKLVKKEVKQKGLTLRQVVEYGLKIFLESSQIKK